MRVKWSYEAPSGVGEFGTYTRSGEGEVVGWVGDGHRAYAIVKLDTKRPFARGWFETVPASCVEPLEEAVA